LTGAERRRVGKSRDRTLFQINNVTEMEMVTLIRTILNPGYALL